MIFGDKEIYAIEVYNEPQFYTKGGYYPLGGMCLHLNGEIFGDIDDSCNALGVTHLALKRAIENVDKIKHNFDFRTDLEIFEYLDNILYLDDTRTYEQMVADGKKYWKFDFLTNGGIMFDRTKSFIYLDSFDCIHILSQTETKKVHASKIEKDVFLKVTKEFISWFDETEKTRPD